MRGILVVLDGLNDLPCLELSGKTPLEVSETPNLDFFISNGKCGIMYPVKKDFIPESDQSIMSIFGTNALHSYRGRFEAIGAGFLPVRGDLVFRVNFASVDKTTGKILDRRVGRTLQTSEAEELADAINKIQFSSSAFLFRHTFQHRAVLILKGGFSDSVSTNDSGYFHGKFNLVDTLSLCKPLDESDNSQYSVNIVNEFLEKACEVLENHPVNKKRIAKGLFPANCILLRGASVDFPKLLEYRRWMAITYTPLERGFAKLSNINIFSFDYPRLNDLDAYENIEKGLNMACEFAKKTLKKKYELFHYAYIHINETDLPGHDNKPVERKLMIEYLDKNFFSFLKDFSIENKIPVVITANQSTPCCMKNHTADPVPVLYFNPNEKTENEKHIKFHERNCVDGELGIFIGNELLKKVGFDK